MEVLKTLSHHVFKDLFLILGRQRLYGGDDSLVLLRVFRRAIFIAIIVLVVLFFLLFFFDFFDLGSSGFALVLLVILGFLLIRTVSPDVSLFATPEASSFFKVLLLLLIGEPLIFRDTGGC